MNDKEKVVLQREIIDSLDVNPHGRLILAPRVGKTKIVIDLIKRDNPKSILWVTPSAELANVDIVNEFSKWKAKKYISRLTTVTWMSLNKIGGCFDWIILDEEQFATENNLSNFFDKSIQYNNIISMTGTKSKHEEKSELYKKLDLKVLYELSINDAVDIGLLSNYEIKVIEVPLGAEKNVSVGSKEKPFLTSEISHYQYLDKMMKQAMYQKRSDITFRVMERRRFIANSNSKFVAAKHLFDTIGGRRIVFSGSIEQAEKFSQNTYHSKTTNEDLKAFQKGSTDELAMVNTGGTGFTYKEIDHLMVVQSDSDKNGLTSQKISRTLLAQKDYKACIWLFILTGTQDNKWVESVLDNFDRTKIEHINFKNLL